MYNEKNNDSFIYDAFISYRHTYPDSLIAEKLHRILETYRTPRRLAKQGVLPKIGRVFRDKEELPTSSSLSRDIDQALQQSRFLIVVCSPRTPESNWIAREITRFRELHGPDNILALLIEGEPSEAFPESLHTVKKVIVSKDGLENESIEESEPLAADIRSRDIRGAFRALNTEKLRLLAPMIGCRFDDLKQRHRERTVKRWSITAAAFSAFFFVFGMFSFYQLQAVRIERDQKEEQRLIAEKNRQEADENAQKALENAEEAGRQEQLANENAARAREQEQLALEQRDIARKQTLIAEERTLYAEEQRKDALEQRDIARRQTLIAQEKTLYAEEQKKIALEQRDKALINQSLFLADMSKTEAERGNTSAAMLLAKEALPADMEKQDRPYVAEAEEALYGALYRDNSKRVLPGTSYGDDAIFSPDGQYIVKIANDEFLTVFNETTGDLLYRFKAHTDTIRDFAFSRDSRYLVAVSQDMTAKVWEVKSGKLVSELKHDDMIFRACFQGESHTVITSDYGDRVILWEAETGRKIREFKGRATEAYAGSRGEKPEIRYILSENEDKSENVIDIGSEKVVATVTRSDEFKAYYGTEFSPDGRYLAEYSPLFSKIRVWNLESGGFTDVEYHNGGIRALKFSSDGRYMLTASEDSSAVIFEAATGKRVIALNGHEDKVLYACFSRDDEHVLTCSADGTSRIWSTSTGKVEASLASSGGAVWSGAFSPDGKSIVTSAESENCIWSFKSNPDKVILSQRGMEMTSSTFAVLIDGGRLVTVGYSTVKVWDVFTGKLLLEDDTHSSVVTRLLSGSDGKYLVSMSSDRAVVRNARSLDKIFIFDAGEKELEEVCLSPDNSKFAVSIYDPVLKKYTAEIWDMNSKKLSRELPDCGRISFISDGGLVLAQGATCSVWNMNSGMKLSEMEDMKKWDKGVISPDGKYVAAAMSLDCAGIWDSKTGKLLKLIRENKTWTNCDPAIVRFTPDGRFLVHGTVEGLIYIWDMRDLKLAGILEGHEGEIKSLEFSHSGTRLLSSSADGNAYIWDAATFERLASFDSHKLEAVPDRYYGYDLTACFSSDDNFVLTYSYDGTSILWRIFPDTAILVEHAAQIGGTKLTMQEKKQFFLISSQEKQKTDIYLTEGISIQEEANRLAEKDKADKALPYFYSALDAYKAAEEKINHGKADTAPEKDKDDEIKTMQAEVNTSIAYYELYSHNVSKADAAIDRALDSTGRRKFYSYPDLVLGDLVLARGNKESALRLYEESLGKATDDDEKGEIYDHMSWAALSMGDIPGALEYSTTGISYLDTGFAFTGVQLARAGSNHALIRLYNKDPAKAVNIAKESLRIATEELELPANNMTVVLAKLNLAHTYLLNDEYEKAKALYTEIKDIVVTELVITKFKDTGFRINEPVSSCILDTFEDLKQAGISHPDMEKIISLLE